jgi:hypothetical protein
VARARTVHAIVQRALSAIPRRAAWRRRAATVRRSDGGGVQSTCRAPAVARPHGFGGCGQPGPPFGQGMGTQETPPASAAHTGWP